MSVRLRPVVLKTEISPTGGVKCGRRMEASLTFRTRTCCHMLKGSFSPVGLYETERIQHENTILPRNDTEDT